MLPLIADVDYSPVSVAELMGMISSSIIFIVIVIVVFNWINAYIKRNK